MVSRRALALVLLLVLVVGCKDLFLEQPVVEVVEQKTDEISEEDFNVVVTSVEGEFVNLNPEAIDPDGDKVSYIFSKPFDKQGRWQTRIGDEGYYMISVRATDGMDFTVQDVLVKVLRKNRAPTMSCPERIKAYEGGVVEIDCDINDEENDEVNVEYKGFMQSSMKTLDFKDAGTHKVTVTAWDDANLDAKLSQEIIIDVKDINRPPVVEIDMDTIHVKEGDVVSVRPRVNDPDGDKFDIKYSEPLDRGGMWRTKVGDAGVYDVSITVSDGTNVITKEVVVNVIEANTEPVFVDLEKDIFVNEGDIVKLEIEVDDRENDELYVKIEGFMTDEELVLTYDDAFPNGCSTKGCTAVYDVTITVSDGKLESKEVVKVHVKDTNRPPVFRVPA